MQRLIFLFFLFFVQGLSAETSGLKVAGFGSAKYTASDKDRRFYNLSGEKSDWTSLSNLGLNFSKRMGDKFQGITQLIGLGGRDQYNVDVDLIHLIYSPVQNVRIIVGKQKLPALLYSRYRETAFLYHYMDLPPSVYQIAPIRNFSGITVRYTYNLSPFSELSIEAYGGQGGGTIDYGEFRVDGEGKDLLGIRLDFDSKDLRVYTNINSLTLKSNIVISADIPTTNPAIGGLLGGGPSLPDALKFDLITNYNFSKLYLISGGFDYKLGSFGITGEYTIIDTAKDEVIQDLRGKYSYYIGVKQAFLEDYLVYYNYMNSHQPESQTVVPIPNDETHLVGLNYLLSEDVTLKAAFSSTYYFGKINLLGQNDERLNRYYGGLDFVF